VNHSQGFLSYAKEAFHRSQSRIGSYGPLGGLWIFVVQVDEGRDVGLELREGLNASPDLPSRLLCEPAFDLIDPWRGRREADMVMRPGGEPPFDRGYFLDCVMIHDNMDTRPFRHLDIDRFEELQELDCTVTLVAFAE
jgi:hypothetical protein